MKKTILSVALLAALSMDALANSFAIVIDRATLQKTQSAVEEYRKAVEADGLKTYVIAAEWKSPTQVRDSLEALYLRDRSLEGCVLVGDVPIAMIRNAQHMTTAFKMDEKAFPIMESSVPSDRFYDDLHLKFDYIEQDKNNPQLHYYKLREDCPQRLSPTFYSARIKYPEGMGGDKYAGIAQFLQKAAKAKKEMQTNKVDRVFTFNGASYNMDCLMVYMDEEKAYRENFPLAFGSGTSFKHWNFRMQQPMRYHLLSELRRTDLDVFMFHEHGAPTQQLINNPQPGTDIRNRLASVKNDIYTHTQKRNRKGEPLDSLKEMFTKKFNLGPDFWADYDNAEYWKKDSVAGAEVYISLSDLEGLVSNPKFVMFDACYNGSFHENDQIAGRYIFNPGQTLCVQGNTRNVLQDRWTIEMIGLLSHGVRIGHYNRMVASLEGHLIGDPTARFAPVNANTLSDDIITKATDAGYWRRLLSSPYADIQCLAMRMLADMGQEPALLDIFRTSQLNTVRMEALKLLSRKGGADFTEAVRLGLNDPYERIARSCADYAGRIGDTALVPEVVRVLFEDEDRVRIQYALNSSIYLFPEKDIVAEIKRYFQTHDRMDKDNELKAALKSIGQSFKARVDNGDATIADTAATDKKRMQAIRLLRNNPRTQGLDQYLAFTADSTQPLELRVAMAEALGWFNHSWRKDDIVKAFGAMLDTQQPDELKAELIQTIRRIEN